MKKTSPVFALLFLIAFVACAAIIPPAHAAPTANQTTAVDWHSVLAVDAVGRDAGLSPAADLLAVELGHRRDTGQAVLRFSFLSLREDVPGDLARAFVASGRPAVIDIAVRQEGSKARSLAEFSLRRDDRAFGLDAAAKAAGTVFTDPADPDAIYLALAEDPVLAGSATYSISATQPDGTADTLTAAYPAGRAYEANCAFVLHGNQGIGYTDVLHGRSDDLDGSGFDEAMQVHEATGVPGNFHMSGTLMTAAEWAARNGDPVDFNAWLAAGVGAGWAGMITSAYGQHIMPFVNNEMNDWSVAIQADMVETRYGYTPRVAWVPERGVAEHLGCAQRRGE